MPGFADFAGVVEITRPNITEFLQVTNCFLPSAEFICLRVAYREALWEELSRLL